MTEIKPGDRITVTAVVESAGHDDQHVIVRIGGRPVQVPIPVTTPSGRWNRLRDEIEHLRTAAHDVATDFSDEGMDASRVFGRVEAFDQVLALMAHAGEDR